jgi:UDP-N-acetylmuramoylalanine--D-glutamate ligase
MKGYQGLPHRMENLGTTKGILFINDSKATTMDSVLISVDALLKNRMKENSTLHLLLGGQDKNLPWESLNCLQRFPNINIYFFGQCGSLAKSKSQLTGGVWPSLGSAFSEMLSSAKTGDTVLLSPGGTSLDEFSNFENRGDYFKNLVQKFSLG